MTDRRPALCHSPAIALPSRRPGARHDPTDGRRVLIGLTDSAVERLSAYLDRIEA